ncbi:SDR family NAD(P)-dependent oxidoreductase [Microtetraspora malaysiensis]|uniref:SDR family NAD(P)-dependent oxidoreductase n=1 Tax=Microtetraspora malaysiensis TaxID=161358 RepID=UPI003D8A07C7
MQDLEGRNALVTGGAGDIGAAVAAELIRRGAHVTLLDVKSPDEAQEWITTASAHGEVGYVRADVRDRPALDAALERLGKLDIAIANAGIVESAPFLEITTEQWERHLGINLTGTFHTAQAAARRMVAQGGGGRIVLTGSWVGTVPWPEIAAYSASKAGVAMLARSMAKELAPHGILVNALAPGIVAAGLAKWQFENEPAYAARASTAIPLGAPQTAQQVAKAAAFLCSPDSDYITGTTLLADGGCSLFNQE